MSFIKDGGDGNLLSNVLPSCGEHKLVKPNECIHQIDLELSHTNFRCTRGEAPCPYSSKVPVSAELGLLDRERYH
jgi:hypothetical protein